MRTTSQPDALTARRVDEICDRFERAWRGGHSPRIETHLQGTEGAVRDSLLRELLLLEIDLRLESAERPPKEEYLERFPSEAGLIEEIFQEVTESRSPSTARTVRCPGRHRRKAGRVNREHREAVGEAADGCHAIHHALDGSVKTFVNGLWVVRRQNPTNTEEE